MIHRLKCLVFIALSLFITTNASASHIFGVDLYYTYVSGNTYTVSMAVYGDCGSSVPATFATLYTSTPEIEVYNGSSLYRTLTLQPVNPEGEEVTPVCASQINNTNCNGGTVQGVRKFVYTQTITLSGASANWLFHFDGAMGNTSSAGRSNSIGNIIIPASGSIITLDAKLNNVTAPNSSSVYTTIPTPFFCDLVPANFNPGAVDPNTDSLSFALVPGIDGATGQAVNYNPGFSATQPLAVTPGTFAFDPSTGQLTFTPNLLQRSLVVYTVSEYRRGVLVGTSQREMTVVILACNNTPPTGRISSAGSAGVTIIDSTHLSACGSTGTFSFRISPTDSTTNETISVAGLPTAGQTPATFNVSNNGTSTAQGNFSWSTAGVTPGTYNFFITFKSDACPLASTQTVAYSIIVTPASTPAIAIAITDTNMVHCAGVPIHFASTATNTGTNPSFQWKKNGVNVAGTGPTYTDASPANGDVITSVLVSSASCITAPSVTSNAITTTVHSSTIPIVSVSDNATGIICANVPLTFTASAIDTGTAASYQWTRDGVAIAGATQRVYIDHSLQPNDTIGVIVNSNAPVCAVPTTSYLAPTVLPAPDTTVTTSGLIHICTGDSVTLYASGVGSIYQWQRNGVNIPGANSNSYKVRTTGNYAVYIANTFGCAVTSSVVPTTLLPLPTAAIANVGGYLNICTNDSLMLATYPSYTQGYTYQWYMNGNMINGATTGSYLTRVAGQYKLTVSNNGCTNISPTLAVTTIQAPTDTLLVYGQTVMCPGGTGVTLTGGTAGSPESYMWYVNGRPVLSATAPTYIAPSEGTYTLKITDTTNGCAAYSQPVSVSMGITPVPVITYQWPSFKTGPFSTYQWYSNNGLIAGATSATYTPTQSGAYTVMVTDANGCTGMSANYYFAYSGVKNVATGGADIKIYPNPANDIVYINAPVAINAALYAMDGRLVQSAFGIKQIDISGLASGVYMIRITDENDMVIKMEKLVKN